MKSETLADGHHWYRICEASWVDPLDPTFAQAAGGRWNPPESWPTLYLNEDLVTARLNLDAFIAGWPYEPEDLKDDTGPHLAVATLPRNQTVADVHTPGGVKAVGLPATYPTDARGRLVPHGPCQAIGATVKQAGLRGVRCRSAQARSGAGRELAWFPATSRSRAHLIERMPYIEWFWG
ncbi:MAG: RES family NAD+ phosphorylase [Acidimicrobiia bacterium]